MPYVTLSKSEIWSIMDNYYNKMGPEAWNDELVPSDMTSNKFLASIYTNLILACLEDWLNSNANDNDEPIYIIEIGAGHGKFSFYILSLLFECLNNLNNLNNDKSNDNQSNDNHGADGTNGTHRQRNDHCTYGANSAHKNLLHKIKFIMSDISEKNIASWRNSIVFKKFIDFGILDFALFNASDDKQIKLLNSGKLITQNSLNSPIITICNYLFDTLPHDAFQIINKQPFEQLVQIKYPKENSKTKIKTKSFFDGLQYEFNVKSIEPTDDNGIKYYGDKSLNNILTTYNNTFDNASFLIPIGGINCIKNLQHFTTQNLITFVADKGNVDLEELNGLENPEISFHGSVSLMVNFDALKKFTENNNGLALMMPNEHADFQIACYVNKKIDVAKLEYEYNKTLADFSPQDLFNLCYTDDDELNPLINSINSAIAILQLSKWDPGIFNSILPKILEIIENEENGLFMQQEKILMKGAINVWNYYYDLEASLDLAFDVGLLYYALDKFDIAISFFEKSLTTYKVDPETLYNIALCHQALNNKEMAIKYCKQALTLQADHKEVIELLKEYD